MSFCANCGKELSDGVVFCSGCGAKQKTADAIDAGKAVNVADVVRALNEANDVSDVNITNVQTEPASLPNPKRKINKKIIILLALIVVVMCIVIGIVRYFTSDAYEYKKAIELIKAEQYEEAFAAFEKLGDYKDANTYLPFRGKYIDVGVGDQRTLEFDNGEYTRTVYYEDDDDSVSYGEYKLDGYSKAFLTDNDGSEKRTYSIYQNYIYETENEDFVFDEKVESSKGFFNAEVTESANFDFGYLESGELRWEYFFEDDGTYEFHLLMYLESDNKLISDSKETGTYEVDGAFINLIPNDDSAERTFLMIDGYIYRDVYVRDYNVD